MDDVFRDASRQVVFEFVHFPSLVPEFCLAPVVGREVDASHETNDFAVLGGSFLFHGYGDDGLSADDADLGFTVFAGVV